MILAQSDPFTTADAITLGIASLGAFTGIASLAITISQFWLSGPRVRATVTDGWSYPNGIYVVPTKSWDVADSPIPVDASIRLVVVTATNRGRMAASITSWGLVVDKDGTYYTPNLSDYSELPASIAAGETKHFPIMLEHVIEANRGISIDAASSHWAVYGRIHLGDGRVIRSKHALNIPTA